EALEYAYPLRVTRYAYRRNSGGNGAFRGGDGLVREIELLADAQVTILADRRKLRPYGLHGGSPGASGITTLVRGDRAERQPGKCSISAMAGDIIGIESPGGGGYGEPGVPGS